MAGEAYQVDYIINLQDNASAGITKFSQAASKLTKAAENLKKFEATFNQVVAKFDKPLNLSIETATAHKRLDKVLAKIKKIQTEAGKINVGVTGGVGKNGGNRQPRQPNPTPIPATPRGNTRRPATLQPASRQPAAPKPRAPRRVTGSDLFGYARINSGGIMGMDMLKGMGLMYGVSAIGTGMRDIIQTSAEYENTMQTARNILKTNYKGGNFNAAFADMEKVVREVGMETKFTAPEVADAVRFLAMAGLPIESIKKAIRPIADIALIGDTELGETADVMTNIMTAYKIKPDDMRKTADIMTRTFTMSNTTLMELAESFKMSGSILQQAGVPFETAAAAFGVLGDAGIKATMAGTTMRTIIANMRRPTKSQSVYWASLGVRRYDENGELRDINDIFGDLAKVNNKRGQGKKAQEEFRKLQEEFAPQFDNLEEGSGAWRRLEELYNKRSDEIQKNFGGVDMFRLFRMTAASGAGVLVDGIEKWNKIIEENFLSAGLSKKLADAKKNQIIGLWAQLKSAFQEQGLRLFQENDGLIRGYLNKAISFVKSDNFAKILRGAADLLKSIGGYIIWITEKIVNLYQKFSPLVKLYMKFQIFMSSIGKLWTAGTNIINSYKWFSGRTGGLFGNFMGPTSVAATAEGMGGLMALWLNGKNDRKVPVAPIKPETFANDEEAYEYIGKSIQYNMEKGRYDRRFKMAKAMNAWSGFSSMAGMAVGGILGSAIAPETGGTWGTLIGGGFGAIAPALLASGPWGIAATAAVAAVTGIVAAVKTYHRNIEKADAATRKWMESVSDLGISKTNFTSQDMVISKSMEIMSSKMLDLNQKMQLQIELYKQLKKQKEGFDDVEIDYQAPLLNQAGMETAKETIDAFTGVGLGKNNAYKTEVEKILNDERFNDKFTPADIEGAYNYNGVRYWFGDRSYPNDFKAFVSAQTPSNPNVTSARNWIENERDILSAPTTESFDAIIGAFWNQRWSARPEAGKKMPTDAKFDELTVAELLTIPAYANIIKGRQQEIIDEFMPYRAVLAAIEKGELGNIDTLTQKAIGGSTVLFNLDKFGKFGTQKFMQELQNFYKEATDEYGNKAFLQPKDFADFLEQQFESTVATFNKLPDAVKPYFVRYLDKTMWEDIGKGYGLDLSNFIGGYYRPERKDNEEKTGDFDWSKGFYIDENGYPYIPGFWKANPKKILSNQEAETAVTAVNNGNAATAQAYQMPFYRPDWMPENTLPPLNNEVFRPVERKQMAIASRPIIININADRIMDVSNIDIDNQYDTETLKHTFADVLVETFSDVANDNAGLFNLGVAYG